MTRGLCPFAIHKLIAPGSNDPPISPRAAILHVDAGGARTLFSFFKFRSGGIESHFHIRWTGRIEQYRNIFWQADANHLANDFAVSIETQGFAGGKWTRRQLRSIKRLLLWIHEETGREVRLVKIDRWDGSGVGYHIQFGSPGAWTPVAKSCPGPDRIRQFHNVLVPWMSAPQEEDDMFTEDDRAMLREVTTISRRSAGREMRTNKLLRQVRAQVSDAATLAEIDALLDESDKESESPGGA